MFLVPVMMRVQRSTLEVRGHINVLQADLDDNSRRRAVGVTGALVAVRRGTKKANLKGSTSESIWLGR